MSWIPEVEAEGASDLILLLGSDKARANSMASRKKHMASLRGIKAPGIVLCVGH